MSVSATPRDRAQFSAAARNLPERVLIVRLGAMGDVIHGLPAVAALRGARPDLCIGWLIEERWSELLCAPGWDRLGTISPGKPLVNWVHTANFSSWRRALFSDETWREALSSVREVRAQKYDLVLDLQGAIRSATVARLSGARSRIGAVHPREAPARLFYTQSMPAEGAHVIEQALSLVSHVVGEQLAYVAPILPRASQAEAWADELCASVNAKRLAIVNPGAGWGAKCWPAESYGAVARALHERGVTVLVNHGPGEELLANAVQRASNGSAVAVKCSISELIALTRRAVLFIGGDTGPMHLAAALCVPVVALFGPTLPERNGPFATRSIVLRSPQSQHNPSHHDRPDEGLITITPTQVITAADQLLGTQLG